MYEMDSDLSYSKNKVMERCANPSYKTIVS
jgi:hypothetical protein